MLLTKYNVDLGKGVEASHSFFVKVSFESVDEHSDYSDILTRTRLKESHGILAKQALKSKDDLKMAPTGQFDSPPDSGPGSPTFVIADSPLQLSKGSSGKGSNNDIPSVGKRVELKTGRKFFSDERKDPGIQTSSNTLGSGEGEDEEEDQEIDMNMEEYLKSLENI